MDQGFRLDSRWYGPNTITIDDPICADQNGEPWQPENAEGGGSSYTLQSATAHSVNTVFAQLVVELGELPREIARRYDPPPTRRIADWRSAAPGSRRRLECGTDLRSRGPRARTS
mgnify:CR=1 FL=1